VIVVVVGTVAVTVGYVVVGWVVFKKCGRRGNTRMRRMAMMKQEGGETSAARQCQLIPNA
jgi:hypothetical protein